MERIGYCTQSILKLIADVLISSGGRPLRKRSSFMKCAFIKACYNVEYHLTAIVLGWMMSIYSGYAVAD